MGTSHGDLSKNPERDILILFLLSVLSEDDDPWYVTADDASQLPEGTFLVGFDVQVEPDVWDRVALPMAIEHLEAVEAMVHVSKVMDYWEVKEYTTIGRDDFFSSLLQSAGRFLGT
jgi:hypothetical protein